MISALNLPFLVDIGEENVCTYFDTVDKCYVKSTECSEVVVVVFK